MTEGDFRFGYVLIFQIYFFIYCYQSQWGADKLILSRLRFDISNLIFFYSYQSQWRAEKLILSEELSNEIFDTFVSCSLFDSKISSYIGYEAAILFFYFQSKWPKQSFKRVFLSNGLHFNVASLVVPTTLLKITGKNHRAGFVFPQY